LRLLHRYRGRRPIGFLGCGVVLTAMNGGLVLVADMGPGNRGRERKHDQGDRGYQNAHYPLLRHDRLL
jgi:hypothetical protein